MRRWHSLQSFQLSKSCQTRSNQGWEPGAALPWPHLNASFLTVDGGCIMLVSQNEVNICNLTTENSSQQPPSEIGLFSLRRHHWSSIQLKEKLASGMHRSRILHKHYPRGVRTNFRVASSGPLWCAMTRACAPLLSMPLQFHICYSSSSFTYHLIANICSLNNQTCCCQHLICASYWYF